MKTLKNRKHFPNSIFQHKSILLTLLEKLFNNLSYRLQFIEQIKNKYVSLLAKRNILTLQSQLD